jgi:transcriptional regulator with GAF, ATPase, and Fis domain
MLQLEHMLASNAATTAPRSKERVFLASLAASIQSSEALPQAAAWNAYRYEDWADLAAAHGVDSIMVVPLTCAGQDLGALVLAARLPAVLDAHLQRLASDLGHALSQTLYTLACIGQMRAGEAIIQDIMPQKVNLSDMTCMMTRPRMSHGAFMSDILPVMLTSA